MGEDSDAGIDWASRERFPSRDFFFFSKRATWMLRNATIGRICRVVERGRENEILGIRVCCLLGDTVSFDAQRFLRKFVSRGLRTGVT